jgi:hypothetical protein
MQIDKSIGQITNMFWYWTRPAMSVLLLLLLLWKFVDSALMTCERGQVATYAHGYALRAVGRTHEMAAAAAAAPIWRLVNWIIGHSMRLSVCTWSQCVCAQQSPVLVYTYMYQCNCVWVGSLTHQDASKRTRLIAIAENVDENAWKSAYLLARVFLRASCRPGALICIPSQACVCCACVRMHVRIRPSTPCEHGTDLRFTTQTYVHTCAHLHTCRIVNFLNCTKEPWSRTT